MQKTMERESQYRVDIASTDDLRTVIEVWDQGLPAQGDRRRKFDWYYRQNPEGPPRIYLLKHGPAGEVVGACTVGRRRMQRGEVLLAGGLIADFVVVPRHRKYFPALTLQTALLRDACLHHPVLFGMPHPHLQKLVRRRAENVGYRKVGESVRMARVLQWRPYLSRALPDRVARALAWPLDRFDAYRLERRARAFGFRAEWVDVPDERFNVLWNAAGGRGPLIGVRDRAYLHWRFVDCPQHSHRFFALCSRDSHEFAGYAACRIDEDVLHVADFLVHSLSGAAADALWAALLHEARKLGLRSVSVEFMGSEEVRAGMRRAGFVVRGTQAVYAWSNDVAGLDQASDWYLTNADEDG